MSASAAAPTDAGDSAAPPPSPSSAEPLLPTRHIVRPRERVFPPISILALMELKASTIHEDDRPFSAPSNAQRLLTRLAVRNKITHGEDNEPAPVTLPLKREAGELSEAAPAITEAGEGTPAPAEAQPTEQQREGEDPKQTAAPVVPVKRRRARRDVILGEIRAVAEMKGEDVAHLMQAELAENGNLPHVYPEDIVEFQSALFTASTMYSTEGGSTKKQASKNKIKVFAGKPCYSCRRAHVLCDYQRPCSVSFDISLDSLF